MFYRFCKTDKILCLENDMKNENPLQKKNFSCSLEMWRFRRDIVVRSILSYLK